MPQPDPLTHINLMRDYAIEARDMAAGQSRSDLDADRVFGLAVWKALDLASVAASRVPDCFRARHPNVAWDETSGFRDRLAVDEYGRSDFDAAWHILQREIPPLIEALESALAQEGCRD